MKYSLHCAVCGFKERNPSFRCRKCNSILEVRYDYSTLSLAKGFRKLRVTHKKYSSFFPIKGKLMSIGEGGTTLRKVEHRDSILHLKMETENPTRSFKDRGSTVDITKAVELGFDGVCCASTGNMGLSVATYARKAGLECTIFISSGGNEEKKEQIRRAGAELVDVKGEFNTALVKAEMFARKNKLFLCGDYHYRKEGQKSIAFEIIEQLKYRVPDYLFVQVGNATLLAATYKALSEFKKVGLIGKFPRLVAVQSSACAPLVHAYKEHKSVRHTAPRTYADAIAVGFPTFGFEGIAALNSTNGTAIAVSDREIERARLSLFDRHGIRSEPGGAVGYAGFTKLYDGNPRMFRNKRTAIVITGNNEIWDSFDRVP